MSSSIIKIMFLVNIKFVVGSILNLLWLLLNSYYCEWLQIIAVLDLDMWIRIVLVINYVTYAVDK